MGKGTYNKVSRRHTIIKALAITMLAFLICECRRRDAGFRCLGQ